MSSLVDRHSARTSMLSIAFYCLSIWPLFIWNSLQQSFHWDVDTNNIGHTSAHLASRVLSTVISHLIKRTESLHKIMTYFPGESCRMIIERDDRCLKDGPNCCDMKTSVAYVICLVIWCDVDVHNRHRVSTSLILVSSTKTTLYIDSIGFPRILVYAHRSRNIVKCLFSCL